MSKYVKGDYTRCYEDICEIWYEDNLYCIVHTDDADKIINALNENEQLKQREQTLTAKIDRILHQRDRNEKQHLKVMSYLHDNYYSIWEECLKELGD